MKEANVHGHTVKFNPQDDREKQEFEGLIHHLQNISFDEAESLFSKARNSRVSTSHDGHSFSIVAESSSYLIEIHHSY